MPEFGAENDSALSQVFLLLSAVLRARGRFQTRAKVPNPGTHQTPVETLSESGLEGSGST